MKIKINTKISHYEIFVVQNFAFFEGRVVNAKN